MKMPDIAAMKEFGSATEGKSTWFYCLNCQESFSSIHSFRDHLDVFNDINAEVMDRVDRGCEKEDLSIAKLSVRYELKSLKKPDEATHYWKAD